MSREVKRELSNARIVRSKVKSVSKYMARQHFIRPQGQNT